MEGSRAQAADNNLGSGRGLTSGNGLYGAVPCRGVRVPVRGSEAGSGAYRGFPNAGWGAGQSSTVTTGDHLRLMASPPSATYGGLRIMSAREGSSPRRPRLPL